MENIPTNTIPVHTLSPKMTKGHEERFEAICRFVDILTPQEIKGLTKFYHETWTTGEFYNYVTRDMKYLLIAEESDVLRKYSVVIQNTAGISSRLPQTKLHLSFRYKYQKFAYVLVSLAPSAQDKE